jgi:hypothetical protein
VRIEKFLRVVLVTRRVGTSYDKQDGLLEIRLLMIAGGWEDDVASDPIPVRKLSRRQKLWNRTKVDAGVNSSAVVA